MLSVIKLDQMIKKRKLSIPELSIKTNIPETILSNLHHENADNLTFINLLTICDVLECEAGEIMEVKAN